MHDASARRPDRRLDRTGGGGAVRDAAARRSRRARDQDRAARRRRLRARATTRTVNGLSSYFVWLNRSKESLTLDLKRPDGAGDPRAAARARRRRSSRTSRPAPPIGSALAPAALRARHPRLIVCDDLRATARRARTRDEKAYDLLVQSEVGLVSITGHAGRAEPRRHLGRRHRGRHVRVLGHPDRAARARRRPAQGATVEVSLFDALAEWMGAPAYYTAYGGAAAARARGGAHATIAPYELFVARRRRRRSIWRSRTSASGRASARDVLGRADAAPTIRASRTNPLRVEHREALHDADRATCSPAASEPRRSIGAARAAGIACARRERRRGVPRSSAARRARTAGARSTRPAGPLRALSPPVQLDGVEPRDGRHPALGQHTEAILQELGFDAGDDRGAWREGGT